MTLIPYAGAERVRRAKKAAPVRKPKAKGGYALMDKDSLREIARAAGRKGGRNVPAEKRTFSTHAGLAKAAARKGGLAKAAKARARQGGAAAR